MDLRSIGALLLKLTGLVIVVIALVQLPGYFALAVRGAEWTWPEPLATAAIAIGPVLVLGLVLWFFPGTITNKVVSGSPSSGFDFRPIELIALTVLGLFLAITAVIDIVRDVVYIIAVQRQNPEVGFVPAAVIARLAASGIALVIGAYLCIGAKGVAGVIERMRG